jgi:hypothetical protein
MREGEQKTQAERRINYEPVRDVQSAIEKLRNAAPGSKITILTEDDFQEEEIKNDFRRAGIKINVESSPTLTYRPGTIEYHVEVVE